MNTAPTTSPVREKLYEGVNCITFLKVPGNHGLRSTNYFDVPDESFTDGNLTGVKAAYEVMAAARTGEFDAFQFVYEAAIKVLSDSDHSACKEKSGAGAAIGFMWTMTEILEMAAQKLDLSELMASSFKAHEDMLQDELSDVKTKNAAFMSSLKEAEVGEVVGVEVTEKAS